ncbi:hypothetical protein H2199_006212 [Coniosporium tulheliwenetii]|uniref:Uncharacterized protein n=1 Tax=Coniosporium tulheliwenetii TaxID=3383036 RepID=A0ACC2YX69_9PEZI|nr:hypothetical protein H2199_006212 [Cladosporium sp. JES 115]
MSSADEGDPFLQGCPLLTQPNSAAILVVPSHPLLCIVSEFPELVEARNELEATLQDLTADLQDLVDSVKAVEHDPYKYGLEIDEVERRRHLVEEVGGEVEDMREELQRTVHDAQSKGKAAMNGTTLPDPDSFGDEDDNYAAFEQERQLEIMHEQDEALDGVFQTVGNLRQQADDMGRELEEQAVILDDVDTLADRVGGKLQTGIKKVGWVIKKNEGWFTSMETLQHTEDVLTVVYATDTMSSCCIAVLIFVLILLLILVLVL